MANPQSIHPETVDSFLTLLGDPHCRAVLSYFAGGTEDALAVVELAAEICDGQKRVKRVATHLHHSTLPRLSETRIVDYDARSRTVKYEGHTELETVIDELPDRLLAHGFDQD